MAMTNVCQKSIFILQDCRNKAVFLQFKRSGTECAVQNVNFLTSPVANGRPLPPVKSFTWFWWVTDELLPIYCFIPSTCPAHDVTNFIDFDWFRQFFGHFLIWNYSSLNLYSSGTRRDIKKRWTVIFLIFATLSNSAIKEVSFAL